MVKTLSTKELNPPSQTEFLTYALVKQSNRNPPSLPASATSDTICIKQGSVAQNN